MKGIGDTIRVSLTEEPEAEIPVARMLAQLCDRPVYEEAGFPLKGECNHPVVVADLSGLKVWDEEISRQLGFEKGETDAVRGSRLKGGVKVPEMIYTETLGPELTKLPIGDDGGGPSGVAGYGSCIQSPGSASVVCERIFGRAGSKYLCTGGDKCFGRIG